MKFLCCSCPNSPHLTACGNWAVTPLTVANFIARMLHDELAKALCPNCVDNLEFNIRQWRELTKHAYDGPK